MIGLRGRSPARLAAACLIFWSFLSCVLILEAALGLLGFQAASGLIDPRAEARFLQNRTPFFVSENHGEGRFYLQRKGLRGHLPEQRVSFFKKKGVKRIVVIGESSSVVLSQDFRNFARENGLEGAVEMIGLGIKGATLEDLIFRLKNEVDRCRPDLLIILFGHNLYFSDFIPARAELLAKNLLNRSALAKALTLETSSQRADTRKVPKWFERRLEVFIEFLESARRFSTLRGIPLILCTIPGNLEFPNYFVKAPTRPQIDARFLFWSGKKESAIRVLEEEQKNRPTPAGWFELGEWLLSEGRRPEALRAFHAGTALEPMIGRAPPRINEVIRAFEGENVRIFDLERRFQALREEGMSDWSLFWDLQHVGAHGARLESRWLADFLKEFGGGIGLKPETSSDPPVPDPPWLLIHRATTELLGGSVVPHYQKAVARKIADEVRIGRADEGEILDRVLRGPGTAETQADILAAVSEGFWLSGRSGTAFRVLRLASSLNPRSADLLVQGGLYSLSLARRAEAARAFSAAAEFDPERRDARRYLELLNDSPEF